VAEVPPAGLIVIDIALLPRALIFITDSDAHRKGRRQWTADESFGIDGVKTAIADIEAGLQSVGRLGGDIIDRAAGRVLAEESALRPLQHFDPLEVQNRAPGHRPV